MSGGLTPCERESEREREREREERYGPNYSRSFPDHSPIYNSVIQLISNDDRSPYRQHSVYITNSPAVDGALLIYTGTPGKIPLTERRLHTPVIAHMELNNLQVMVRINFEDDFMSTRSFRI